MDVVIQPITIFLKNLLMISLLSGVASYIVSYFKKRSAAIILGLFFGILTIFTVEHSIPVKQGAFISCTQILITLAGYTGGPITAGIAAAIGVLKRIHEGGCGTAAGITVIVFFAYFGCYLRQRYTFEQIVKPATLHMIGCIIAVIYLFIMLAVNGIVNSLIQTINLIKHLFIPILIFIPVINFIVFKLFFCVYNCSKYLLFIEAIMNNSGLDIGIFSHKGTVLFASNGLKDNTLLKTQVVDLVKRDRSITQEQNTKVSIAADGGEKIYSLTVNPCPLPQREMGWITVIKDITEQQKNVNTINELRDCFDKLFNAASNPIIIAHRDGTARFVNAAFQKLLGYSYEEVIGKTSEDLNLFNDGISEKMLFIIKSQGYVRDYEITYRTKDGRKGVGLLSSETIIVEGTKAALIVIENINDRRNFETEIARLERLNLIGQMAAGIGHEVRNPLTTVRGYLQLMMRRKQDANCEHLQLMINELDRANAIISEFLSLAKNKMVQRRETNLNDIIKSIVPLLEAQALMENKLVRIDLTEIDNQLLDEKEITQMILNLSKNGLESMKQGGTLTIRTYQEGDNIVLVIADQGHGFAEDVLANIGTPFVTTKDTGTGLGLPICYSIAHRHNATIKVDTCSLGTSFKIIFLQRTLNTKLF